MTANPETLRFVDLTRLGADRFLATNVRGGTLPIGSGDGADFTPVELLLAGIAGCSAMDVDAITSKRAESEAFDVRVEGHKIRDDLGNRLVDLTVTFSITFPEGEAGDKARDVLPRSLEQTRDRLCTVARTVAVGTEVAYRTAE